MTKKFLVLTLCLFILGTFISACGGGGKTTPPSYPFVPVPTPSPTVSPTPIPTPTPTPEKYPLELSETEFTVNIGETTNITVTLNGEDITQTATYTVDQEAIATVEGGLITGVSVGIATVTVNAENAESAKTFTVNVVNPTLSTLEVNPKEIYLGVDGEDNVTVTLEGKDVTEDVTYTSDDESIATAEKGIVKGLTLGTTNITVSLEGANSAVFEVNVVENPFKDAQKGDEVEFGRYPQTADGEVQPIKWRVLARDDENKQLLAISVYGLYKQSFAVSEDSNVWANSDIRSSLNGDDFYNGVFDNTQVFYKSEKGIIKTSNLSDVGTSDNVFLLSKDEVENADYFENGEARICQPTAYMIANGYSDNCYWWLRSPHSVPYQVYLVAGDGRILDDKVPYKNVVRPAIWIKL